MYLVAYVCPSVCPSVRPSVRLCPLSRLNRLTYVRGETDGRTDGQTDGRYQVHYLPRFAVDNELEIKSQ